MDAMEASLARAVETLVVSPATSSKSTTSNLVTTASSNLTTTSTGSMEALQDALERPSNPVSSPTFISCGNEVMESAPAVTLTESSSTATPASLNESQRRTDYVPAGSSLIKRPTFTFEALIHKNQVNETAGEFL